MTLAALLEAPQFSLRQVDKEALLLDELKALTRHHLAHCPDYARLVAVTGPPPERARRLGDLPFLPVSLFKSHTLKSIPDDQVQTVMTSSGTTSQQPSRIFVDRATAALQARALAKVITHVVGRQRLPMLIADTRAVIKDSQLLSARGAGVLGMMRFGRDHTFLLDEDMQLQEDVLADFLKARGAEPFLIFGFTFMVWMYFHEPARHLNLRLSDGILIHSGGWKKLAASAVDNATFRAAFAADLGLRRIYNFYGMVEQIGSIFLEGDDGLLYAPNFSDVIIRDPRTWAPAPHGDVGVIQVLSALPRSYPGHSLLTEDLGVVEAVDSGCGGRLGKAIRVVGRVPKVELRGCSDVHAFDHARDPVPA
jgi:hypothetical protein